MKHNCMKHNMPKHTCAQRETEPQLNLLGLLIVMMIVSLPVLLYGLQGGRTKWIHLTLMFLHIFALISISFSVSILWCSACVASGCSHRLNVVQRNSVKIATGTQSFGVQGFVAVGLGLYTRVLMGFGLRVVRFGVSGLECGCLP